MDSLTAPSREEFRASIARGESSPVSRETMAVIGKMRLAEFMAECGAPVSRTRWRAHRRRREFYRCLRYLCFHGGDLLCLARRVFHTASTQNGRLQVQIGSP